MQILLRFFGVFFICCFMMSKDIKSQVLQRHQAITAYIYNFAKNVHWQNEEAIQKFHFTIIGQDQTIINEMKNLAKTKTLRDKPILVSSSSSLTDIEDVQLVFVLKDSEKKLIEVFDKIEGKNILLVTDGIQDKRLVMINFLEPVNGTLRFEINKANIINQHLRILEDMILLGGSEVDVAALYREGQQSLRNLQKRTESLEKNLTQLEADILEKTKEIQIQKNNLAAKIQEIREQQNILNDQSQQLRSSKKELSDQIQKIQEQQKIYDRKSHELESQKEELQKGSEILSGLKKSIDQQNSEIAEQEKVLAKQGKTIQRQQNYLYLLIIIVLLAVLLVAAIYNGYKSKRELSKELEKKVKERTNELRISNDQLLIELTERKQTEEKLKYERLLLRTIIDNLPDAIYTKDNDCNKTLANKADLQNMGAKFESEILGKNDFAYHPKELAEVFYADDKSVILSGEPLLNKEEFVIGNNGEKTWLLTSKLPLRDEKGKTIGLIGIGHNITERKKAEEKLRQSEEQFRLISENVADMIVVLDLDGKRVYSNPSYKPLLGNVQKLIGSDSFNEIHSDDREKIKKIFFNIIRTGKGERAEYRFIADDGETHYIESIGSVIRNDKGNVTNVVVVSRDVTLRKKAEDELRKYQEQLEEMVKERTAELEIAKDRAESADRLKSAFLATMSHELRTPLNSIIGFTGILMRGIAGPLNAEQLKQLGMAKGSAQHLLELINDVLDISKIEAGQLVVEFKEFDLTKTIHKVVATVQPLIEKKELKLVQEISPSVKEIISDERRVDQILPNLINNAIKFTETGSIKVVCEKTENTYVIKVIDSGIGIKREDVKKLFKPFSQIDTGLTRAHEGTGLGLSISQKLVEKLGGSITVESEFGIGSTFTVILPVEIIN